MILEIVIAFLSKAGDYLVPPVGRQIRYFHRYRENVEDFGKQVEKLGGMRERVRELVNETKRNGDLVKVDVQKWLTKVDQILLEAEAFEEEIKLNKRCFGMGWCPDWSSRYKLSKEARKKAAVAVELLGDGKMDNVSVPAPPPGLEIFFDRDFVAVESTTATMDRIMQALQDDECDIVGVYGMGGIGKTTFVRELGKKAKENKLFDCVAMAVVSQTPNLIKIQGQVADMLGLRLGEESEFGRAGRIHARLKNEKRVLMILDDVWAKVDLAAIGIPYGSSHKGLKIILTTRRENVCSVMGRRTKKFPLTFLSMEESWNLFRENAGAAIDSSTLNTVAMEVARKCRGLPLALVTVGRALQDKDLREWKTALQQLKKSTPLNVWEVEHDVFSCLKLSYDYLESEEIKQFVLFCCLFPEDHDISVEDLGRFGMGKGLFRDVDTVEEARCQAQAIVKHLKASCLLLDSDKEGCVKMHDTVRDVAISIASRDNGTFLVRAGSGLKDWPKKETFEHYTDISLMTNDIQKLPGWLQCPSLEVLLLGENEGFEEIPNAFFEGMPQLRVLDLSERIGIRSLPLVIASIPSVSQYPRLLTLPPSLKSLGCLQTLHLNNCKLGNVSILGKLKKLEVLSFCGSDIQLLPADIGGLNNLRLLDLSFCQYLQSIPPNVLSQLSQLEELYMGCSFRQWSVEGTGGERSNACLSELRLLHRLVILCVEIESMSCFPTDLHLHKLLRFEVSIGCDSIKCYPESRSLHLREIKDMLIDEVKVLFKTADEATLFCLMESSMTEVAGTNLNLNMIKTLTLSSCINMLGLACNENSSDLQAVFTALEELHLRHMQSMFVIISIPLLAASFQKLRILNVQGCHQFFWIVDFKLLIRLQNLEEVLIRNCQKVMTVFKLPVVVDDEHVLLFTVRKLALGSLPNLSSIWRNGSSRLVLLNNLKEIDISFCNRLEYVFPYIVAESLLQLEILGIKWCQSLERIVAKAEGSDCIQSAGFPNLKVVKLEACEKLTSLFSVATDEGTMLPKLKSLQLRNVPILDRLCSESFTADMPSLEELVVEQCKKMESFAADPSAYGLQSAPRLIKLQVDGQILDAKAIQDLFKAKV